MKRRCILTKFLQQSSWNSVTVNDIRGLRERIRIKSSHDRQSYLDRCVEKVIGARSDTEIVTLNDSATIERSNKLGVNINIETGFHMIAKNRNSSATIGDR